MVQDILTYITVAAAFIYSAVSFYKLLKGSSSSCAGGCSTGCSAKSDLLKHLEKSK
ncbi:hypothetical protein QA597_00040 [Marinilabiliaceae bacterium ANBcel2]|nr:hypothetical protein [Marinilabiliaceae bacterium ANBcel2]